MAASHEAARGACVGSLLLRTRRRMFARHMIPILLYTASMSDIPLTRIDTVFLPVRNLARAIDWYSTHLGWPVAWQNEGIAVLTAGPTPLTLLQHRYPGLPEVPEGEAFQPAVNVPFNFYAPDIRAVHRLFQERGVDVDELNERDGVQDFTFRDPDGNQLSVVWWPDPSSTA